MNEEIMIRAYKEADKLKVLELFRLNTPAYFAAEEESGLLHYLDHELDEYFLVEQEGRVVGCGGINFSEDGTTAKISWDIFHPEYQGKGLGSLLLQYRIRKLKELPQVQTISVRTSQLVYSFYEKNGFHLEEVVVDHWAPGFDLYRMVFTD